MHLKRLKRSRILAGTLVFVAALGTFVFMDNHNNVNVVNAAETLENENQNPDNKGDGSDLGNKGQNPGSGDVVENPEDLPPNPPVEPEIPTEPEIPEEPEEKCLHESLTSVLKEKASFNKDGKYEKICECEYTENETIPSVKTVTLSAEKFTYDGKVKQPTITVKDAKGNVLKKGTDYTVVYGSGRKNIGRYAATITLKGQYEGTKTLYFTILPTAPSSVSATLYGYDDVKLSWKKVSGASGYAVYYKKATDSKYSLLTRTTNLSVKKGNLTDGAKYTFKVVPYKTISKVNYESLASKATSIDIMKKMEKPTVSRSSNSYVTVKWKDIAGQSGYQISKSSSKTKTSIVATYSTSSGTSKKIKASTGKGYYYKVRAYKTVNKKKYYGPWSDVVYYKNPYVIGTHKDSTSKITVYKEWYQNAYCYIAHLEFTNYSRFKTSCANGKYKNGTETIKHAYSRLKKPVLIVNGCYSAPYLKYPVARNGKVWNNKNCWLPAVYSQKSGLFMSAWETGGTPGIAGKDLKTLAKDKTVTDTFCFGPPILQKGKVTVGNDKSRAQRTFIGTNGKPGDIWVVVSDGRKNDGKSSGLTYKQCAQLLKNKGCTFGVPLDGGGSSTMMFKGKTLNKTTGRRIVDFVYFK